MSLNQFAVEGLHFFPHLDLLGALREALEDWFYLEYVCRLEFLDLAREQA